MKLSKLFFSALFAIFLLFLFSKEVAAQTTIPVSLCGIKYQKSPDTMVCTHSKLRVKIWNLNTNLYTIYWQYAAQTKLSSSELHFDFDFYPTTQGVYYVRFEIRDLGSMACARKDSIKIIYNTTSAGSASFTGLKSSYCIAAFPEKLTGSPAGGLFSGPGVYQTTSDWFFDPNQAGPGTHTICYRLGCLTPDCRTTTVNNAPCVTDVTPKLPDLSSAVKIPQGVTTACDGTIYFSDSQKNVIWQVDGSGAKIIIGDSTQSGNRLGPAEGPSAVRALLNFPTGLVTVDNVLYFCDAGNHAVKKYYKNTFGDFVVELVAGANSTAGGGDVLGAGTIARFNSPFGIAMDRAKTFLYVADSYNNKVKKISLVAPTADVSLVSSHSWRTFHLALDNNFCYVALPQGFRVQRVNLTTSAITDFFRDIDDPKTPYGVSVGCGGDVYVAETTQGKIFRVTQSGGISEVIGLSNPIGISVYTKGYIDVVENFPSGGAISRIALSNWKEGAFNGLTKKEFCLNDPTVRITPITCADAGSTMSGPGITGSGGLYFFNPSAAGVGTHYITYKYSAGFCTDSLSEIVHVYPIPEVTLSANTLEFCTQDTITLTAKVEFPSLADTIYWNFGGNQIGKTVGAVTTLKVTRGGVYNVTSRNYKGCTSAATIELEDSRPRISLNDALTVCTGDSVQLNPNITGPGSNWDYGFTWSPGTGLSSTTIRNPYAKPTIATKYIVTATHNVTSCRRRDSVEVGLAPKPPKPTVLTPKPYAICPDADSISIGGPSVSGITYKWEFVTNAVPGGIILNRDDIANPRAKVHLAATGTYRIKVTATDGSSCTNADTVIISPHTKPIANAGPDRNACVGAAVQIGSTSEAFRQYSWTPITGLSSSTIAQPNVTRNTPGSYTYILTVTNQVNTCRNYDTVIVNVTNPPAFNARTSREVCQHSSIVLGNTAVTGVTYEWVPITNLSNPNIAMPTLTASGAAGVVQYIRLNKVGDCVSRDTVDVTVLSNPIPSVLKAGSICAGSSFIIGGSSSPNATYQWTALVAPQPTLVTLSATNVSNPTLTAASTAAANQYKYQVVVTYNNGCTNTDSSTINIISNSINAGADQAICAKDSVVIGPAATLTGTFSWTPNTGLSSATVKNPKASPSVTTQYILSYTSGSCTARDTVIVSVAPAPVANANGPTLCVTSTSNQVVIGSPAVSGNSYSWTPDTYLSSSIAAMPTATIPDGVTSIKYVLTVSRGGCVAKDSVTVQNGINPNVSITKPVTPFCTEASKTLQATSNGVEMWWRTSKYGTRQQITAGNTSSFSITEGGRYYAEAANSEGCRGVDSVEVIDNRPRFDLKERDTICGGQFYTISPVFYAPTFDKSFTWSPLTNLNTMNPTSPVFNVPNPSSPTTYTYTLKVDSAYSGGACTRSKSTSIRVNPTPNLAALGGIVLQACPGKTTTVPLTNPGNSLTYKWVDTVQMVKITGPLNINNPTIDISFEANNDLVNAKTYVLGLEVSNVHGCVNRQGYRVNVLTKPAINAGTDRTICRGASTVLGDASLTLYHFNWSVVGGEAGGLTNILTPTVSPTVTSSYALIGYKDNNPTTNLNNCYNLDTVRITVNPVPIVSIPQPVGSCSGDSTTVTAVPDQSGYTYLWSTAANNGGIASPTAQSTKVLPDISSGSLTYNLEVSNSFNCKANLSTSVAVAQKPANVTAFTNNTMPKCPDADAVLEADFTEEGGHTYTVTWAPPISLSSSTGKTVTASPNKNQTYTATVTDDASLCFSTATVDITVTDPQVDAGEDLDLCFGQGGQLNAVYSPVQPKVGFIWSLQGESSTGLNNDRITNPTLPNDLAVNPSGYNFIIVVKDTVSDCSNTDTVMVRVFDNPVVNTGAGIVICSGTSVALSANPSGGAGGPYQIVWENLSGSSPMVSPATTGSHTYNVEVTDRAGCKSTGSKTINVEAQPVANIVQNPLLACDGQPVTLVGGAVSSDFTYEWQDAAFNVLASGQTETNYSATSSGTYYLIVTNFGSVNQCRDTAIHSINFNPVPVIDSVEARTDYCINAPYMLVVYAKNNQSYQWTTDGFGSFSNTNRDTTYYTPDQLDMAIGDTIRITVANSCASVTEYRHIKYNPAPEALFIASAGSNTINSGSTTPLVVMPNNEIVFNNTSDLSFHQITAWSWNFSDGNTSSQLNPVYAYTEDGNFTVNLSVSNVYGCTDQTSIAVTVSPVNSPVKVPNVFSPSANHADNKVCKVYGLNISSQSFNFRIFNRWGEVVFETNDFTMANNKGWDGANYPPGVYTWTVKGRYNDGKEFQEAGTVTLIR
ncbi:MAG: PKD domain-containing protein [Cytophagaceae bacterium]